MKNIAFIYPGQGSQKIGMGQDFFESSSRAKEMIESAGESLKIDFKSLMFEENEKLSQTQYTQPSILLVSAIANELFRQNCDIKPKLALGHSLGEFSALYAVGALDFEDGINLVHQRGKLMQEDCDTIEAGMMVVLGLEDKIVEDICSKSNKSVWPANYNSDGQIVIAGIKSDLISIKQDFIASGAKRVILLDMSVASHCELLTNASNALGEYLQDSIKDDFIAPVISNVTAQKYNTKEEALSLLQKQLISPVKYKQSISNINDIDLYIEFGGNVLRGLNRNLTKTKTIAITDSKSLDKALEIVNS